MGRVLLIGLVTVVIYLAVASALILSDWPTHPQAEGGEGLAFDRLAPEAAPLPEDPVEMRDGTELNVRHLEAGQEAAPLLLLVHGSGWDGGQFAGLARRLEGKAEIVVPDLRGHGRDPLRRGDLDHIGQLEEDLADLIAHFGAPGQRVILAGHSSGGGLVVRFAGGPYGGRMDRAVLMAPFLQHDAPTTRENSGGWARPLTRRIVGLSMLNPLGLRALNGLTAVEFAFPRAVLEGAEGNRATTAYSYRMMTSFAPRSDYLSDVAALPSFLLIAGAADEAFHAGEYRPVMRPATDRGRYEILEGAGHLDIVDDPRTTRLIAGVLDERT